MLACEFSIEKHTGVLLHHIMCLRIVRFCSIAHLSVPSTPKIFLTVQTFRFIIEFYSQYAFQRALLYLFFFLLFFNMENFCLSITLLSLFA